MHKTSIRSFRRAGAIAALAVSALLASGAASAELKVGTLFVDQLLLQSPQFKASQDKMKAEFEKRGKDFDAEVTKFKADADKFNKEKDILSSAARAEREKTLSSTQVDLNFKKNQLQEDIQNLDRKLMQEMQTKIKGVIDQIAKDKGLDLVVRDPIFTTEALDITDEVLKALGGAAPAAAAKPAKK